MLNRFLTRQWALVTAVTVVTVVLAGGVVLAMSPARCNMVGHCASSLTAARPTLSPSPSQSPFPTPPPRPIPTAIPPIVPTTTPPFAPPTPTRNPSYPPYEYPATSGLPPMFPQSSSASFVPAGTLSCRLPIYAAGAGSGGFVVFADGSFVADPRSGVALPPGAPSPAPGGGPYGPGYGYGYGNLGFIGLAYDHQQDRWLPVGLRAVSPDGSRYAYTGQDGIYVVKLADSSISEIGEGRAWNLTDVEAEGVYASQTNVGGLWWLPFSGAAQQITANGYWQAVGGGAAYGTATAAVPQGVSNVILRLDLKTGATRPWFMVDAGQSTVLGVDTKGAAIIQSTSFGTNNFAPGNGPWVQVWSVPSSGGATVMLDSDAFFGSGFNGPIVDDSHGLWFNGSRGIYLIGQGDGRLHQATSYNGQLAGGCV